MFFGLYMHSAYIQWFNPGEDNNNFFYHRTTCSRHGLLYFQNWSIMHIIVIVVLIRERCEVFIAIVEKILYEEKHYISYIPPC